MPDLKFICPHCGSNSLGSVEQVIMTYPIKRISEDGDLDYNYEMPQAGDSEILAYQCRDCGYELQDKNGNSIVDCITVPEWIKKNNPDK